MFPTVHRPTSRISAARKGSGVFPLAIVLLLAVLGTLLMPAQASGQGVQLPCRFYGVVELDFAPVPDGTVVTATINGDSFTATTPAPEYGGSTYSLKMVPPEGRFYRDGDLITFQIGTYDAAQPATWEAGNNIELNLSDAERIPMTETYVSDESTLVALSNNGVDYGQFKNAVATWVHSVWPKISDAKWISSAYQAETPSRDSWRKFSKDFTLPPGSASMSGKLQITADNAYSAYLNGVAAGSDSSLRTVETWETAPRSGTNTLTVVVRDSGVAGSNANANPTGLVYRLVVNYEAPPGPPTPTPSPTPTPTPTASPSPSPTAAPTVAPTTAPTPTPDQGGSSLSAGKVIGIAIFALIDLLLIVLLVYLVWKFYVGRERGL